MPFRRTGSHRSEGFALFCGPGLAAGRTLQARSVLDLPPTLLELLGFAPDLAYDGQSLADLLRA